MALLLILGAFFAAGTVGTLIRRRRPPTPAMHAALKGDPSMDVHAGFSSQNGG